MQNNSENPIQLLTELKKDIEYLGKTMEDGFVEIRILLARHDKTLYGDDGSQGLCNRVSKVEEKQTTLNLIQAAFATLVGIVAYIGSKIKV